MFNAKFLRLLALSGTLVAIDVSDWFLDEATLPPGIPIHVEDLLDNAANTSDGCTIFPHDFANDDGFRYWWSLHMAAIEYIVSQPVTCPPMVSNHIVLPSSLRFRPDGQMLGARLKARVANHLSQQEVAPEYDILESDGDQSGDHVSDAVPMGADFGARVARLSTAAANANEGEGPRDGPSKETEDELYEPLSSGKCQHILSADAMQTFLPRFPTVILPPTTRPSSRPKPRMWKNVCTSYSVD